MPLISPPSPPALVRPAETSAIAPAMRSASRGDFRALEALAPTLRDPALSTLADAALAASRLEHGRVRRELEVFNRLHDHRRDNLAMASSIAAGDAFASGDYRAAASSAERLVGLLEKADPESELEAARQLRDMARLLRSTRPQRVVTPLVGSAPATRDAVGLVRTDVVVSGSTVAAVVDTGANLSVVSSSLARRLGLEPLSGRTAVKSSARNAVPTRIAVASSLRIAGVRLRNVAFLVLDDADLALPVPGYRIDMIIGFPVLKALRRVTIAPERISVGASAGRTDHAAPLRVVGNDLHVVTSINGVEVPLQIDTGAASSSLTALLSREHPELANAPTRLKRSAGAGGSTETQAAALANARVQLAGVTTVLPSLDVETETFADVRTENYGSLGQDVLRALPSYTIDFGSMTLEVDKAP